MSNNDQSTLVNKGVRHLQSDLGRWISAESGDVHGVSFLFQRISVVMQRFNSVLLYNGFLKDNQSE